MALNCCISAGLVRDEGAVPDAAHKHLSPHCLLQLTSLVFISKDAKKFY